MSDAIFIAATIVFYAMCALYVNWCDKIIGPDDFRSTNDLDRPGRDDGKQGVTDVVGSSTGSMS